MGSESASWSLVGFDSRQLKFHDFFKKEILWIYVTSYWQKTLNVKNNVSPEIISSFCFKTFKFWNLY